MVGARCPFFCSASWAMEGQLKYSVILNSCRGFRGCNFETDKKKNKLLIQYESAPQKVTFYRINTAEC
jgi:hypothetical protein